MRVGNADELAKKHTRIEHYGDCPKMQHHVQRFPLIHEECVRNGGGGRSAQQLPNIAEDGAAILLVRPKNLGDTKIAKSCAAILKNHGRLRSDFFRSSTTPPPQPLLLAAASRPLPSAVPTSVSLRMCQLSRLVAELSLSARCGTAAATRRSD